MITAAARAHCVDTSSTLAHFDFDLPAELIAQAPAAERDHARLMLVDRTSGVRRHDTVRSLPEHLRPGDLLVVNDTRVIRARLKGHLPTGGKVEFLALRACSEATARPRWVFMAKPAKRLRPGLEISLDGGAGATVTRVFDQGRCELELNVNQPFPEYLQCHGEVPLPPYIERADGPRPEDGDRYQTIFARMPGAIAAPTAGLHFTDDLVGELRSRAVDIVSVTLHVGPGTFLPIRTEDYTSHTLEPEWYDISPATAALIRSAKTEKRRIVAVGTTTTRALESAAARGDLIEGSAWADLFVTPGHRFRVVDALFTNFHLPKSTLLLLVSAFASREIVLEAYRDAVACRYRFYSYGDAMLLS
jgi:S-adenosylmethionine:tRNA ribosyltransferase-isomerase